MYTIERKSFAKYFFLSMLTLGIYGIVMLCKIGDEVNLVCEGDGKKQPSFIVAWLLGMVTFGIYPLIWYHKAMDRLQDNAYRYGVVVPYGGSDFLLWLILGSFIFVGPFIAMYHFFNDINAFCDVYDYVEAAPYTPNLYERASLKPRARVPLASSEPAYATNNNQIYADDFSQSNGYVQDSVPARNNTASQIDPVGATEGYGANQYGRGKITGLSGMFSGAVLPIQNQELIKIGRDPSQANIILEDPPVSALHCSIMFDYVNRCYVVTDYSTNGTVLGNGRRLDRNVPVSVPLGSVIHIVDSRNSFRLD